MQQLTPTLDSGRGTDVCQKVYGDTWKDCWETGRYSVFRASLTVSTIW